MLVLPDKDAYNRKQDILQASGGIRLRPHDPASIVILQAAGDPPRRDHIQAQRKKEMEVLIYGAAMGRPFHKGYGRSGI